jgi:hypothetical protein
VHRVWGCVAVCDAVGVPLTPKAAQHAPSPLRDLYLCILQTCTPCRPPPAHHHATIGSAALAAMLTVVTGIVANSETELSQKIGSFVCAHHHFPVFIVEKHKLRCQSFAGVPLFNLHLERPQSCIHT